MPSASKRTQQHLPTTRDMETQTTIPFDPYIRTNGTSTVSPTKKRDDEPSLEDIFHPSYSSRAQKTGQTTPTRSTSPSSKIDLRHITDWNSLKKLKPVSPSPHQNGTSVSPSRPRPNSNLPKPNTTTTTTTTSTSASPNYTSPKIGATPSNRTLRNSTAPPTVSPLSNPISPETNDLSPSTSPPSHAPTKPGTALFFNFTDNSKGNGTTKEGTTTKQGNGVLKEVNGVKPGTGVVTPKPVSLK